MVYFKNKFKTKDVKRPLILVGLTLSALFNLYFHVKLVQNYNPFAITAAMSIPLATLYFILAMRVGESLNIVNKQNVIVVLKLVFYKYAMMFVYLPSIMLIPVEFSAILRRLSQLSVSVITDRIRLKINEVAGIAIILVGFFVFAFK